MVGDASCVEGGLMRGLQPARINASRTSQHTARKMTFINGARVAVLILFTPFPHHVSASGEQANQQRHYSAQDCKHTQRHGDLAVTETERAAITFAF